MPKKRKPGTGRRQFNLSFPPDYAKRIEDVAAALGLDATALLRMMVRENLHIYEARAEAITKHEKQ